MSHSPHHADGLVVPSNFIRAVREAGYLSISTAIAELVDNALQASATEVAIEISRVATDALPEISVCDNGIGMSKTELEQCLRFGGSSHFDARESFGRFGMGLPAASLSQARRVEVTAWRGGRAEQMVALDVDEIAGGASPTLVARRVGRSGSASGCRVRWIGCDRIEYQRLAWLERALRKDLGRIYRRFLNDGLHLTINGDPVEVVDPTLCSVSVEGASGRPAFEELTYELATADGETSSVTVRFVMLPVHRWHRLDNITKRRLGIVGGGGVSILRAGREIANGWHLMGGKRKENYDDWWRCEIEFDPDLDEDFGITINKQGVRPSVTLREALEPELESIARLLNARVRESFEEVKFQAATEVSCRIAAAADADLPVITSRGGSGALDYRIGSDTLPMTEMFRTALTRRTLDLTLNADHPVFAALYQPLQGIESEAAAALRTSIELFLLAFARSAVQVERDGLDVNELLAAWSATYGRMLQKA